VKNDLKGDSKVLRKLAAIMILAAGLVFLGGWWLLYRQGNDLVRQYTSYFQSGTQVFFDEGYYRDSLYAAKVTAFHSGRRVWFGSESSVRGSTLPEVNPVDQYPTIIAGTFPFKRGLHYSTYTNDVYQSETTPVLILNPGTQGFSEIQGMAVKTTTENISPFAGDNFRLKQASHIHILTGKSSSRRGSTGCLTINPDQARAFFESAIGNTGMVHIRR